MAPKSADSDSAIAHESKAGGPEKNLAGAPAVLPKTISRPAAPDADVAPAHTTPIVVAPPAQVVDQPAAAGPGDRRALDTAMIPSAAVGAFVAYPSRVVNGTQHLKAMAAGFEKEFPVPPTEVEQIISLVGFSAGQPPRGPEPPHARDQRFRLERRFRKTPAFKWASSSGSRSLTIARSWPPK